MMTIAVVAVVVCAGLGSPHASDPPPSEAIFTGRLQIQQNGQCENGNKSGQ